MSFKMTWDDWYKLAETYYMYHGNLKVKQKFSTINGYEYDPNGYKLGSWLNNQRQRYKDGILTDEQKNKLELLGMNFEVTNAFKWERMYELAKSYYEHYGHLKIPNDFKTEDGYQYSESGKNLGGWITTQREYYIDGNLSDSRLEKLIQIGMIFTGVYKKEWERMYELAKIYYERYGNLKITQKFSTTNGYEYDPNGYKLGSWLNNQHQRYKDGYLTDEQKKKLELLGINLDETHEFRWERMYELAQSYYAHHGNLKIQHKFRTFDGYTYDENGYKLGIWIADQRSHHKNGVLSAERIERLKLIGMLFSVKKNKNLNIALCEEYGINYIVNKKTINSIAYTELLAKINYLNSLGIPLTSNNQLHPIFTMSNINMQANYGISLEILLTKYLGQVEKDKAI